MSTATTPSAPLLDEQICFALYSASRAITARYRELLEPLGVTYPQYLVLLALWQDDAQRVSDLGRRLQLDSGTLSPLLRRLEQSGLVTRARSAADERTVVVSLTPAGDAMRAQAVGIPAQVCVATGLDLDSIAALRDEVAGLAEHVRGEHGRSSS